MNRVLTLAKLCWSRAWSDGFFRFNLLFLMVLPLMALFLAEGDGTDAGAWQSGVLYGLQTWAFLLGVGTLWQAVSECCQELKRKTVRWLVTGPISGSELFWGKVLGIFSIQLATGLITLLAFQAGLLIYGQHHPDFGVWGPEVHKTLRPALPNYQQIDAEVRQLAGGRQTETDLQALILQQLVAADQAWRLVTPNQVNFWQYPAAEVANREGTLTYFFYLRERTGILTARSTRLRWIFTDFAGQPLGQIEQMAKPERREKVPIPATVMALADGFRIGCENLDSVGAVYEFETPADLVVTVPKGSYYGELWATAGQLPPVLLVLTIIGCGVGLLFSQSVALFASSAYLIGTLLAASGHWDWLNWVFPGLERLMIFGPLSDAAVAVRDGDLVWLITVAPVVLWSLVFSVVLGRREFGK